MLEHGRKILEHNKSGLRMVRIACREEMKKNKSISLHQRNQIIISNLQKNQYPLTATEYQKVGEEMERESEIN